MQVLTVLPGTAALMERRRGGGRGRKRQGRAKGRRGCDKEDRDMIRAKLE